MDTLRAIIENGGKVTTPILIHPDGKYEEYLPEDGELFTLAEMQKAVNGYIELRNLGNGMMLVMDEEGKLKDNPDINFPASDLHNNCGLYAHDYLVGDVLLMPESYIE